MSRFDTVIIGAGHNALVCATYLAKAGQKVLVTEASEAPGGLARAREFHPGFSAAPAHTVGHLSRHVLNDLKLAEHGYQADQPLNLVSLTDTGTAVTLGPEMLTGASDADADAYAGYRQLMTQCARALAPFWHKTMPRLGSKAWPDLATFAHLGLNLKRMGREDMLEFLRIASLPARDLADEFFGSEAVKAAICWDGLIGGRMAPCSPNSAVLAMLYRMSEGPASGATGGAQSLIKALVSSAQAAGVEIRTDATVDKVIIHGDASGQSAKGIELTSGEQIQADRVVSGVDPQNTFFNLVGVQHLDIGFTNRIQRLRCEGLVAKAHIALKELPRFAGVDNLNGRLLLANDVDTIECAFDDAKYGQLPHTPVMEVVIPSLHDSSLAPEGQHVLSAHVMYVPHALKDGWTAEAKTELQQRVVNRLTTFAPSLNDQIIHTEILSPADIATQYGVTGGHWHHTEMAMDQMLMMRPTYGAAQYATPIPNLYLCGAGSHPGGDLTGAPGRNAANAILRSIS